MHDSIERGEATGVPITSDGEQRWSSFGTYAITGTLAGTGLADHLAGDGGQYFAIFACGHGRQLPRLVSGPFRYKTYAADTLAKTIGLAHKPLKQAVIAPSMLALLYPLDGEMPGDSRDQFEAELVDECEKVIRKAFDAGAAGVSVDFTEGRLAARNDPRNPWTGRNLLPQLIELKNRVFERFRAQQRTRTGVHTCPGGDRDSVHSADVDHNDVLPCMFGMTAGYFLIQLAREQLARPTTARSRLPRLRTGRCLPEDNEPGGRNQAGRRRTRHRLTRSRRRAEPRMSALQQVTPLRLARHRHRRSDVDQPDLSSSAGTAGGLARGCANATVSWSVRRGDRVAEIIGLAAEMSAQRIFNARRLHYSCDVCHASGSRFEPN